jgi:Lrp/AsnC family transcriptional regulator for asnA, asnC and gidA
MKIDNLDLEIIKHLQGNARLSFRELGRKLSIPHTTIFTRAERLVKRGIIKKFSAILHPHDLGLKISFLFINSAPADSKNIANEISKHPEVRKVFRTVDGKIIAKIVVPDHGNEGLEQFLTKLNAYPFEIYPVHEVMKFDHDIPTDVLKGLDFYRDK